MHRTSTSKKWWTLLLQFWKQHLLRKAKGKLLSRSRIVLTIYKTAMSNFVHLYRYTFCQSLQATEYMVLTKLASRHNPFACHKDFLLLVGGGGGALTRKRLLAPFFLFISYKQNLKYDIFSHIYSMDL